MRPWRARLYCMLKPMDQVAGVFGRGFHRDHAGDLLAHGGVEEALEQFDLEAGRHDFFQNAFGRRQNS